MVQACLAVLLRLDYSSDRETIKNLPLAKYAAGHFSNHVEFERELSHIQDGGDRIFD